MTRLSLFIAAAATVAATVAVQSPAEARDGCPEGWRNYGYGCVQLGGPFDDGRYGGPGYYGGRRSYGGYDAGYYGGPRYRQPEGSYRAPNFGGNTVRPTQGRDGKMSCSNPGYTWQSGACRPYRGG
jgi:hypothetical protein